MFCSQCGSAVGADARFCAHCGAALARSAPDEGERRHATIVFSDLCGYTALGERLDPEEVEDIMGRVKAAAQQAVERHGGTVNQFVGDEVMALFGIPVARRDDAQRAVRAAMDLHAAVQALSVALPCPAVAAVAMHTGINTGLVIARASDGRSGRFQLTGDTVNTAARLLQLAGAGEIVVGQETWRALQGRFEGVARSATEVKGKEHPLRPWQILGEHAHAGPGLRPIVGRDAELARCAAWVRAGRAPGAGGLLLLRGDPGIGKSRLAEECLRQAASDGFATHRALVLDFSTGRGTEAVHALARSLAAHTAPVPAGREQRVFLASLLDEALDDDARRLASAMPDSVRRLGMRTALRALAAAAAARQPQLLLVEDLHWADATVLDVLADLAQQARGHALLLLGTTRRDGDVAPHFAECSGLQVLDLAPLEPGAMARFAAAFDMVPAPAATEMIARAEGNPLFLEQLLLHAGDGVRQELPGSIQGLVLARMDHLAAADRAALQAASVLGQRFTLDALRWMLDDPAQDCRGLLDHFLLRPDGDSLLFWHALIRDGAYAALLKARRRQLHARAAQWFRARDPALAAEHLERAEDPAAAVAYLEAAQAQARRFHHDQALALIARGLPLAQEGRDRHHLLAARGQALLDANRAEEAIVAWREALATAPDVRARCRSHIGIAAGLRLLDRTTEGLEALAQAEPWAQEPAMALERSRLQHLRGNLCFALGRIDDCLRAHDAALAAAISASSDEAQAQALGGLGDALYLRGRLRSAHQQFGRCVALAHQGGFGRIEVANLHMVGWTAHALCRFDEALDTATRCLELAREVAHRRVEMISLALAGYVGGWMLGDLEAGQRGIRACLTLAQTLGARRFEAQGQVYLAQFALRAGDRELARQLAAQALDFCRLHAMAFFGPVALGLVARLEDDPRRRAGLHADAQALLAAGAVSHCHLEYHNHAIDGALERGDWDAALSRV